jgi:hypothetical protein
MPKYITHKIHATLTVDIDRYIWYSYVRAS